MSKRSHHESITLQVNSSIIFDRKLPCIVDEKEFWFNCREHKGLDEKIKGPCNYCWNHQIEEILQEFSTEYTTYCPDGSYLDEIDYDDFLYFDTTDILITDDLEECIISVVKVPIYKKK